MRMLRYLILLVVALGLAWWLVHVFAHNKHNAALTAQALATTLVATPTVAPRAAAPAMPAPVAPVQPPTPSPYATLHARFVAPTPAPLHGRVRVNVRDALGAYPAQSQTAILNGEDSLVFSNVAPCDCTVEAALDGYMLIETNLSLAMYADRECVLTFTLAPAWTLRGILKDKTTGEPVSGASIVPSTVSERASTRGTRSDAAGMFSCADLAEAQVKLTIAHPDYPTNRVHVVQPAPDADPLVLYLCGGATVFGHVFDMQGTPVPGCDVCVPRINFTIYGVGSWSSGSEAPRATTDAAGAFRICNIVPQEPFTRIIADSSWSNGYADLVLAPGDTREVRLVVQELPHAPPMLKLIATYTNGAPVPELEITIQQIVRQAGVVKSRGGFFFARTSATDGLYYENCSGMQGSYTVIVSAEHCMALRFEDVQFANNCTTELAAIFWPATVYLYGVAERANGVPASGIALKARAVDLDAEFSTQCDADGNYAFASVFPEQRYTLHADEHITVTQPQAPVAPGASVRVVLAPHSIITFAAAISNTHEAIATIAYQLSRTPVDKPYFNCIRGCDSKTSLTQPWAGESYIYLNAAGCKTRELHLTLQPDEDVDLGTIWFEKDRATP